ncbi:MAG: aspartate/tyrosine/aromatic aminotransferase [Gammaproteobacteria bacterium]|uniref:amino acid aminotransferase n=1 Tax=Pseudomaricurvus alcaniphilus TaxID=1166482 RepID=UPI00140B4429|nr:amino acid aminotransferase [Pseudomaricurvus alcaniphilus]MBR9910953.1 aspartate/tyrosine/aromatic aminotransferase [Gammaproteobacteria bacterium]NHN37663.1 aspartate/tyrosine/aromatic aminotransferase [Pseudomaricurvus alcaniphilus]
MFEQLKALPTDPILGLSAAFARDENPDKIDLGVGVYKTEAGDTPVLDTIKVAEARLLQTETSKSYQGMAGNMAFNQALQALIFGDLATDSRVNTLQTPGGCGALRVGAELINRARPGANIWVSSPTWANHIPLLGSAGLKFKEYPYYDAGRRALDFDAMYNCLAQVPAGDVVLLHGCCHNPCGADLSNEQWQAVASLAEQQGFTPFIDLAYQGFGDGIEQDAYGVRLLAATLPELMVASSCSKNFGLYRERTGALSVMGTNTASSGVAFGQLQNIARGIYSMPPAHGASLVQIVLEDSQLRRQWSDEVAAMRTRIKQLRQDLAAALADCGDFDFITRQRGMFSFLGLSEAQVVKLREEHSVYMVGSSRINIAGINSANLANLAGAIKAVL